MRTATAANSLVGHPELAKLGYTAFIPSHKVFRQGIIRGVPTSVSDAELKSDLRSSAKIIDFKRLNRRMTNNGIVEYAPSTTINIKFVGQILPKYVSLYFDMHNVSPFIPRVKTCFSCFRIGHIGKFCKSRPRCGLCGKDPHGDKDTCERNNLPPLCINCAGDHPSTSSSCPLFIKQKEIHALAATDNISLSEARRKLYGGNSTTSPLSPPDYTPSMERNFRNFPLLRRGDRDNSSDLREPSNYSYNKFDPLTAQADHFQHRPKYSQVVFENPTDNRTSRGSGASRIPPGQNQLKHTMDIQQSDAMRLRLPARMMALDSKF
ncbi:hypothetical protein ALC57_05687 [Trachymyrmex cornetzi]|uniref:CCHC-type domain-containing protein n=1 Tax=Trachymyrmex cornetzi TaxID=471704 RepID=A0A151JAM0_9HYME|nr:hypothetical protein ALC57_05687 [Trachymyrmex cornetzi]